MSHYQNLEPGSIVPQSGHYRCIFCGSGGIAEFAQSLLGDAIETGAFKQRASQSTSRYFRKGSQFTECPYCGPATGWSLDS